MISITSLLYQNCDIIIIIASLLESQSQHHCWYCLKQKQPSINNCSSDLNAQPILMYDLYRQFAWHFHCVQHHSIGNISSLSMSQLWHHWQNCLKPKTCQFIITCLILTYVADWHNVSIMSTIKASWHCSWLHSISASIVWNKSAVNW